MIGALALSLCMSTVSVMADTVTLDNDGKEKKNPYGDCELKKSFDADYYDCYVPYNLTCGEIGGYSTGASNSVSASYTAMSEETKKKKVTYFTNYEGDMGMNYFGNAKKGYDEETGMTTYTDQNGTVFYVTAIQHFFYNNSTVGTNGFPGWSMENRGQLVDVILSDGTCVHFIVGDANAIQHTNAGGDDTAGHFDVTFSFADLTLKQYPHLFAAHAGNTLEVWGKSGCAPKFSEKYNIGNGDDKVRIAYYRLYNAFIKDSPKRMEGVPEDVSFSYGDVRIEGGSDDEDENTDSTGNSILPEEFELVGMSKFESSIADNAQAVEMAQKGDLNIKEQHSLSNIGYDLSIQKRALSIDNARIAVVFIGICLIFYGVLLGLCTLFDRMNNFIDISLVKIVSFGLLTYSEEDHTKGKKGYANSGRIVFVISVVTIVGCLLVSGGVLPFMMDIINSIIDKFINFK